MTKKELKDLIYIKRRIGDLKERLKALQEAAEGISVNYSGMPRGSTDGDKMASYAAEVDAVQRKLLAETVRLEELRLKAEEAIAQLPQQQRIVMHLRYVDGLSWYKVSKESSYSIDHCYKIERNAIKNLDRF